MNRLFGLFFRIFGARGGEQELVNKIAKTETMKRAARTAVDVVEDVKHIINEGSKPSLIIIK